MINVILDNKLYISGWISDTDTLLENGITHVLNISDQKSPDKVLNFFNTLEIFMVENFNSDIRSTFETCHAFIESGDRVLVHCVSGRSRSVSIVVSYLMRRLGWNLKKSYDYVQSKREISPHIRFLEQLIDYEYELYSSSSLSLIDTLVDIHYNWLNCSVSKEEILERILKNKDTNKFF